MAAGYTFNIYDSFTLGELSNAELATRLFCWQQRIGDPRRTNIEVAGHPGVPRNLVLEIDWMYARWSFDNAIMSDADLICLRRFVNHTVVAVYVDRLLRSTLSRGLADLLMTAPSSGSVVFPLGVAALLRGRSTSSISGLPPPPLPALWKELTADSVEKIQRLRKERQLPTTIVPPHAEVSAHVVYDDRHRLALQQTLSGKNCDPLFWIHMEGFAYESTPPERSVTPSE